MNQIRPQAPKLTPQLGYVSQCRRDRVDFEGARVDRRPGQVACGRGERQDTDRNAGSLEALYEWPILTQQDSCVHVLRQFRQKPQ